MANSPNDDVLNLLRQKLRERPMRTDLEPVRNRVQKLIENSGTTPTVLQVVGSNGKGSVVHYLSGLLASADRSVVSYTSPHLRTLSDRIKFNGSPLDSDSLRSLLNSFEDTLLDDFTPFEALLLCTVRLALRRKSEYLVLEAGMGGRWDATSALKPEWVILTSLDREHTEYLGNNLRDILNEKLAQVPDGGKLITGPLQPREIRDELTTMVTSRNLTHVGLTEKLGPDRLNRRLALTAARLLVDSPAASLNRHLDSLRRPPGRQERLDARDRTLLFDVAHTPRAVEALLSALETNGEAGDAFCLYGSLEGKETDRIVEKLSRTFPGERTMFTRPQSPRALDPEELLSHWGPGNERPGVESDPDRALDELLRKSKPGDLIVVAGSFHLVGSLRSQWLD